MLRWLTWAVLLVPVFAFLACDDTADVTAPEGPVIVTFMVVNAADSAMELVAIYDTSDSPESLCFDTVTVAPGDTVIVAQVRTCSSGVMPGDFLRYLVQTNNNASYVRGELAIDDSLWSASGAHGWCLTVSRILPICCTDHEHDPALLGSWAGEYYHASAIPPDTCLGIDPLTGRCVVDSSINYWFTIGSLDYDVLLNTCLWFPGLVVSCRPAPIWRLGYWFSRNDSVFFSNTAIPGDDLSRCLVYRYQKSTDALRFDSDSTFFILTSR